METVKAAKQHGVTGYVQNESDGSVTGEAQGDRDSLDKFEQWLGKGPSAARVENVEKKLMRPKDGDSDFYQK